MGRALTAKDVEEIGKEAWDATQLEVEGNPPWDELTFDAKQRYGDVIRDVCSSGGATNAFEQKAAELWAEKQNEEPAAEEAPVAAEADPNVIPYPAWGVEPTIAQIINAIKILDKRTGGTGGEAAPETKPAPKAAAPSATPAATAPAKAPAPAQKKE